MIIEERFVVPAQPSVVADGLLDVVTVSRCVPGVSDVRVTADDTYEAVLQVQIGPIRAAFKGHLDVDRSALPEVIRAAGSGVDRTSGSSGTIRLEATLRETDAGTQVVTVADVALRGRLGQFGSGIVRATSSELLRQFVGCFAATLGREPTSTSDAELAPVGARAPAPAAGRLTLWRLVTATILGVLRQLRPGLRRRRCSDAEEQA